MQKIHDEQNAKFTVKTGSTLLISPFTSGYRLTWPGAPDFKLLCDLEHPFSLAGPQFPSLLQGSSLLGPPPSLTRWCWGSSLCWPLGGFRCGRGPAEAPAGLQLRSWGRHVLPRPRSPSPFAASGLSFTSAFLRIRRRRGEPRPTADMTLVHSWLFGAEMTRGELCWLFVVVAMAMTAPREACPPGMLAFGVTAV